MHWNLVAASLLVFGSFATGGSAAADVPTCNGKPATIVGADVPGWYLPGTSGDDVAVLAPDREQSFVGKEGNDTACGGNGDDSVKGGPGDDWMDGGPGSDVLHGDEGDDELHGGTGDDYLTDDGLSPFDLGPDGTDQLDGDAGDDVLSLRSGSGGLGGADTADGGPGHETLYYWDSPEGVTIDVAAGTATGDAVDTFTDVEAFVGSLFSDVLIGSDGDDNLEGFQDGQDQLYGRGGNDRLGAANGRVQGGPGDDVYFNTGEELSTSLVVALGKGDDTFLLRGGPTQAYGGAGKDTFLPQANTNEDDFTARRPVIHGGRGIDTLSFKDADGRVHLDTRTHRVRFAEGRVLFEGINQFRGTQHNDTIIGTPTTDRLFGLGGNDVIKGLRGNDVLVGGPGRDTTYGGPGRDTCSAERKVRCE